MSVLNKRGEEQCECPLCMEALEVDDLNFFPCTCGYQICRFCWHRIRTDENGLCPACRKAYSENPADFIPLTQEQITALKLEKRQREQQRKAKLSENRKHLANVRVVQKNLVFVVGLPPRLADAEVLKKHEYFGKFGKIHKVVINQSTAYAGTQGPSASAYVTYMKSDDALKAIQNVNNILIDGRVIKSSLGTTKYCSHFMKNQVCPKPDCMYLHDFGDPKASFTKEQMHAGKHQEYERKLHEILLNKMAVQSSLTQQQQQQQQQLEVKQQQNSKVKDGNNKGVSVPTTSAATTTTNKENWPQLSTDKIDKNESNNNSSNKKGASENIKEKTTKNKVKVKNGNDCNKKPEKSRIPQVDGSANSNSNAVKIFSIDNSEETKTENNKMEDSKSPSTAKCKEELLLEKCEKTENGMSRLTALMNDNSSFFSQNTFQKVTPEIKQEDNSVLDLTQQVLNDSLPLINSTEDWEAAFGFSKQDRMDELAKQRDNVKDTLETFGNSFSPLETMFNTLDFANKYENSNKLQDNLLEALSNKQHTSYSVQNLPSSYSSSSNNTDRLNGIQNGHLDLGSRVLNGYSNNGLDHHMSKFFNDFCSKNGQKDMFSFTQNGINVPQNLNGTSPLPNGLNQANNFYHTNMTDRQNMLYLQHQQNRLEEQLMNLQIKQQQVQQQQQQPFSQPILQNSFRSNNSHMFNNDVISQSLSRFNSTAHNHVYQNSLNKSVKSRFEDELDFDPFHETQKGLAELMDSESDQRMQSQQQSTNHLNGLNHGHSSQIPPPPPGFVQSGAHMNSFGSKILPYLNMGNSQQQQQLQQNVPHNNWSAPNNFNSHVQHTAPQQQHKAAVDWKMLDPAIMSSSVNFMVPNTQTREPSHFNSIQQPQPPQLLPQQLQNGPVRSFDFQSYSSYNPQLQPQQQQQTNFNSFSHINNQQNLNWLGNEMNSQIATPPGFRANNQTTKQQEC